jgi:TusA-related sulfurtransferase
MGPWWLRWLRWLEPPVRPLRQSAVTAEGHADEIPGLGRFWVVRTVDCVGASCPRPQLLTMKAINQLRDGEVIELITDNPVSVESIPDLMVVLCSTHLATVHEEDRWRIYLRKGV